MADKLSKVAIAGHSFVGHLRNFIRTEQSRPKSETEKLAVMPSLGLDEEASITFISAPGGGVSRDGSIRFLGRRLAQEKFDVVILILGDNDIQSCADDLGSWQPGY